MRPSLFGAMLLLASMASHAGTISFPGSTVTVPGNSSAGVSFVYSGTLTQGDTIAFTQTGGTNNNVCLQGGSTYCTNGAGVVTVGGTTGVGGFSTFAGTFNGTFKPAWDFGALILEISGEGAVQVFAANAANGAGSATPSAALSLPATSLSALGFAAFSAVNPTITFVAADTNYFDNTRQFVLTQSSVPEPGAAWLCAPLLAGLAVFRRRLARRPAGPR